MKAPRFKSPTKLRILIADRLQNDGDLLERTLERTEEASVLEGIGEAFESDLGQKEFDTSRERLTVLRFLAQQWARTDDDLSSAASGREAAKFGKDWINFLISDESSTRTHYLQEYRLRDEMVYGSGREKRELRPGCYSAKSWLPKGVHPEQLTITEVELALAVFQWNSARPSVFHCWIQARPHILWRVHEFLQKRSCFALLRVFGAALKANELDKPPFRSGEFARLVPQIGVVTFLGYFAVLSVGSALAFFVASPWPAVAVVVLAAIASTGWLIYLDVMNKNRGVMASAGHALPRVWSTLQRFGIWAIAWWLPLLVYWRLLGAGSGQQGLIHLSWQGPGAEVVGAVPDLFSLCSVGAVGRALLILCGLGASAMFVGCVLEWIWDERSAMERL